MIPFFIVFLFKFAFITPYQYSYLNLFNDIFLAKDSFENDYWGVSSKKLISKIQESKIIKKGSLVKFATCGIEEKAQIEYLKKIKNLNFKMVNKSDDYDFILMNNRIIFDQKIDSNKIETCYEKFSGIDILDIKVRGLVISKITQTKP